MPERILNMPDYSLRSESITNKHDESIGPCPDPNVALEKLNQMIGGNGKPCNPQMTIKDFSFKDEGNNIVCVKKYQLVETFNGREVLYPLFPKGSLGFDPYKTTNAAGSFTVST